MGSSGINAEYMGSSGINAEYMGDSWTKGKFFFLNPNITNLLMEFSHEVELLGMRYADVKEKMESMDADVFLTIPCMAILNSLKLKDERIYIFCDKPLDRLFEELKEKTKTISDKGYSIIERGLLEKESDERGMKEANLTKEQLDELINEIKRAAMVLQRSKPADWNLFIETAMDVF
eukprot:TRINITY_DN2800_c0_g1_i9.p1 TRINITY_DN2800_c0_g1~~TRINITY_DN2800_c0_g1_i9.p1  ORF type:complete len:177 (+),score=54.45 TRINITY_DN2800_c0_g1_i9:113-643(+)